MGEGGGAVKTWDLKGYWKKQAEISESIKIEVNFLGEIKKKSCGFSTGVAISRSERLFSQDKVTIYKFQGFFSEMYRQYQPIPFSGTAQYSWKVAGSASHACPQPAYQDHT